MIIKQTKLLERWIAFIKIILDPWLIMLVVIYFLLLRYSSRAESSVVQVIFILLITTVSGFIGGVFMKKWTDLNDEKIMINRGKLSLKNLKLIYLNIKKTEKRIEKYIEKLQEDRLNYDLIKSNFEDIIDKCVLLEEECINSIETWSDLLKEATIKNRLIVVNTLRNEKYRLDNDLKKLEKYSHELEDRKEEIPGFLREQIDKKSTEIKEIKSKLLEIENVINSTILSGIAGSSFTSDNNYVEHKLCPNCGSFFTGTIICPYCGMTKLNNHN